MPRNLVTAQTVIKAKYLVPPVFYPHTLTLYLDCQSILNNDGELQLFGVTNPATSEDWLVHDIFEEIFDRLIVSASIYAVPVTIFEVAMWHNVPDSEEEVFVGFDLASYADITGGSGTPGGGSQLSLNLQTADRLNTKISFMDVAAGSPVRFTAATPPETDDGGIAWFLLRGSVPFSNNDGVRLTRHVSTSYDWNDKLLRSYGRAYNTALIS